MRRILASALALTVGLMASAQENSAAVPPAKSVSPPSPAAADAKSAAPAKSEDASPRAGASKSLAEAPKPPEWTLNAADVRDWRGLAKRLQVMGEADLQPNAAVWKSLSPGAQGAFKRLSRDVKADPIDQRVALNALNVWLDDKNAAAVVGLRAENVRDAELQALLKKAERTNEESHRLNRVLLDVMFPLEVVAAPAPISSGKSTEVTKNDAGNVSRYPPNRLPEVTLSLTVPGLRGRVNVFLPDEQTLVFRADEPVTIKVPNNGLLRYAVSGDDYDQPFPREVTWNPDEDVKNGVVARKLPLLRTRPGR